MKLNNNYNMRNVECALSSALSTVMPVFVGEQEVLQKNASGLVRTLQNAQNQCVENSDDVILLVANYALEGIEKAKSEIDKLKGTIPDDLLKNYSSQLNTIRGRFISYIQE